MNPQAFSALADLNRLRIVELLRERPRTVTDVALHLSIRQPQASKHLRTLHKAGLVVMYPHAQQHIYSLQPGPFNQIQVWLASFEGTWGQRLDKLDAYLQNKEETL